MHIFIFYLKFLFLNTILHFHLNCLTILYFENIKKKTLDFIRMFYCYPIIKFLFIIEIFSITIDYAIKLFLQLKN